MNTHYLIRRVFNSITTVIAIISVITGDSRSFTLAITKVQEETTQPNLILIVTDQHNLRTLGCYRKHLPLSQREIWGDNNIVETPSIDSLADDGIIFTKFYTPTPVCTPSRAALMTGLYPHKTGAIDNFIPMRDKIQTLGNLLQTNGYKTHYLGKWHLDGTDNPGFVRASSKYSQRGFDVTTYMFNRGHWKFIDYPDNQWNVNVYDFGNGSNKFDDDNTKHYTTDFLFSRAINYIQNADKAKQKFAIALSIPDPHPPYSVRPPYDTMFQDMNFTIPYTGKRAWANDYNRPPWLMDKLNENDMNYDSLLKYEKSNKWKNVMMKYFGMVKLIDDSIGKLLSTLDNGSANLAKNTIVVFTSDHGGMMMEHGEMDKGLPYDAASKIPFLIRLPEKKSAGKVIHQAHSSIDFTPTILSLMGVDWENKGYKFDGNDVSHHILNNEAIITSNQTQFIEYVYTNFYAIVSSKYKLVKRYYKNSEVKYFYDIDRDPNEIDNYYDDSQYQDIVKELEAELDAYYKNREPLQPTTSPTLLLKTKNPTPSPTKSPLPRKTKKPTPSPTKSPLPPKPKIHCENSNESFWYETRNKKVFCGQLGKSDCASQVVAKKCPILCYNCYKECKDSGKPFWSATLSKTVSCDNVFKYMCAKNATMRLNCPEKCNYCPTNDSCSAKKNRFKVNGVFRTCKDVIIDKKKCDQFSKYRFLCPEQCGTCK